MTDPKTADSVAVLVNGTDRVDPTPWLAQRGLRPGKYVG